jgi:hypothetical protein
MTREEILNMPAGRELDALIAENVMDNKHDIWSRGEPKCYSTDIAAAWEAVTEISKDITLAHRGKFWFCDFDNQDDWSYSQSDTAPLAICKASLLAVTEKGG